MSGQFEQRVAKGKKTLLIILGTGCVIIGAIGIFLPVLPTTPFLLLAAYCYARSSKRFYQWLITNRLFGEYIRNYREGRGIPFKHKVLTIILLWLTIFSTMWFAVSNGWVKILLAAIAAGVTFHLLRIKTLKADPPLQG